MGDVCGKTWAIFGACDAACDGCGRPSTAALNGTRGERMERKGMPLTVPVGPAVQCPTDILAVKHISRIFGHCNNPALLDSHFQASI